MRQGLHIHMRNILLNTTFMASNDRGSQHVTYKIKTITQGIEGNKK